MLAQVIRFDERQTMGRPRRAAEPMQACVVLPFTRFPKAAGTLPALATFRDDDGSAGRGRDPG